MAHKPKKKTTTHRRKRMSGSSGNLKMVGAVIAGAVGGKFIGSMLTSKLSLSPTIANGVMVLAGGFVIPKYIVKGPMGQAIGAGIAAQAAVALLQSTGVLSGTSDPFKVIMAPAQPRMIGDGGGLTNLNSVSGAGAGLTNLNSVSGGRTRIQGYPEPLRYHPGMG